MTRSSYAFIHLIALVTFLVGCSNKKPYYNKENRAWNTQTVDTTNANKHRVFLIGDAGAPKGYENSSTLQLLREKLLKAGANSTVVFLGDNIYPVGLPPLGDEGREEAERRITAQLKILDDYQGKVVFIPGNHDWKQGAKGGVEQNRRAEKFVNKYLGKRSYYPSNSCAGPEVLKLTNDMIMVVFDTQWWLHKHLKARGEYDNCDISTRSELLARLREIVNQNLDKKVVVAAHHPLFSNGNHGGHFPLREHIFPLSAFSKLYIPLPVIGSVYPWYRKFAGNIQDIPHPVYTAMKDSLLDIFSYHPNLIYAAGHEHNLQLHEEGGNHFIVSGSGCKTRYLKRKKNLLFGQRKEGFVELSEKNNGSLIANFWTSSENATGTLAFSKELIGEDKLDLGQMLELPVNSFTDYTDSLVTINGYPKYDANWFHRLMLGSHYRKSWLAPVTVPVVDLKRMNGGMKIVKIGGNHQTTSVRLETKEGKQFVLRSIDKDPRLALPQQLRTTFAKDLAQDQMTAAHPYGALAVIKMADAVGVYHTNPRLMYVPDEAYLGKARKKIANTLVLYEERPKGDMSDQDSFGNAKKIIGTPKLLEKLKKSNKHQIDQRFVVKNRIFDSFLNDWDRHDDQWRWAAFETDQGKVYRPIPRDRDQVFYKFDGAINFLASRKWGVRMFQHFDDDVRDIPGLILSARWFDRTFTTEVTLEEWKAIADTMSRQLTDEVIEASVKALPQKVFEAQGEEIIRKLKARRKNLVSMAERHYKFVNKEVEVTGSNDRELFYVRRLNNDSTLIRVFSLNKEGKKKHKLYERTFVKGQTKQVRLFGYGGNDRFIISGNVDKGIVVKVIGGEGNDEIIDESSVKGWSKKTHVYDLASEANDLELSKESREFISYDTRVNDHDRKAFKYSRGTPLISLGYNKDDNVFLGAGFLRLVSGFRKDPYAQRHRFVANWSGTTNAYNVKYSGEFVEVLKKWDLTMDLFMLQPDFNFNFYGFGNGTKIDEIKEEEDYYITKFENITIKPGLQRKIGKRQFVKISPFYQNFIIQEDEALNYVSDNRGQFPDNIFEETSYTGVEFKLYVPNFENRRFPLKGTYFDISGSWNIQLSGGSRRFNTVKGELGGYYTLKLPLRTTLAARAGFGHIFDEYDFYQSMFLSGDNRLKGAGNVRGLNRNRYAGRTVFYQNNEIRTKLFDFSNIVMSADFGINMFFDHGRVWQDNDTTGEAWHYAYGGGVWLYPFNMILANVSYAKAENDEDAIYLGLGFFF